MRKQTIDKLHIAETLFNDYKKLRDEVFGYPHSSGDKKELLGKYVQAMANIAGWWDFEEFHEYRKEKNEQKT